MKKLYLLIFYLVLPVSVCYSFKAHAHSFSILSSRSFINPVSLPKSSATAVAIFQAGEEQVLRNQLLALQQKESFQQRWLQVAIAALFLLGLTLAFVLVNRQHLLSRKNQELTQKTQEVLNVREQVSLASEELKAINANLEAIVEERTLKLSKVNRELDMFLYRSSHDLRRPVTTLMGLVEVAKLGYDENSAKYLFSKVNDTAVNMDNMLEKFFMINTINHDSTDYSSIDFQEILEQIQQSHVVHAYAKQVQINIAIEPVTQFVSDPQLITFIIKNLVDNAIVFRSKDRAPFVNIQVQPQGSSIVISIQDNGIGIPEAYLPEIFTIFYRGSEASKGNGLGLYVVKKAIDRLQGDIQVTSKVGEFTRFEITIPPVYTSHSVENQQALAAGA